MDIFEEGDRNFGTDQSEGEMDMIRKGPWNMEEDLKLINYITINGEGRWNFLARAAGLKRTGKSCRLRWLNYLHPDVRRGNISLQEQLLILQLHSRWGNRWSKIAKELPGRTDNEIKNYWRTRVQKLAKQLKCDVNTQQFSDAMSHLCLPRLLERIRSSSVSSVAGTTSATADGSQKITATADISYTAVGPVDPNCKPDKLLGSLEALVSPVSILTDDYNNIHIHGGNWSRNFEDRPLLDPESVSCCLSEGQEGFGFQTFDQSDAWLSGGDSLDNLLNDADIWVLQQ